MASTINHVCKGAVILAIMALCSCTKYNYIDGGLAKGVHDCSMWDYFHTDSYDWDSTIIMIEHAGLKSLFDGTGEYKEITFFGLTNISIERYMLDNNKRLGYDESDPGYLHRVTDIPVEKCRDILQKLVVPKRIMLNDVPRGNRVVVSGAYKESDGMACPCVKGELFLWTQRNGYQGVDDVGDVVLRIASRNVAAAGNEEVVSTDIQTTNGVVQALNYNFSFRNF